MTETSGELLTVIIPCLDEEDNLAATFQEVSDVAERLPLEVRIILVDDGSSDGTRRLMEDLCARHGCSMRVNERNLGLGRSVMDAYDDIPDGSWVTVVPGDNEAVFGSILNFMESTERFDVILGYYQNPVIRTLRRRFASWAFTRIVGLLYGFSFRYYNGLKMYKVEAFRGIEVASSGHAYVGELLAKAVLRNPMLRVGEAPFAAKGRGAGSSKAVRPMSILQAFGDVLKGYRSVGRYRQRLLASRADDPSRG